MYENESIVYYREIYYRKLISINIKRREVKTNIAIIVHCMRLNDFWNTYILIFWNLKCVLLKKYPSHNIVLQKCLYFLFYKMYLIF